MSHVAPPILEVLLKDRRGPAASLNGAESQAAAGDVEQIELLD